MRNHLATLISASPLQAVIGGNRGLPGCPRFGVETTWKMSVRPDGLMPVFWALRDWELPEDRAVNFGCRRRCGWGVSSGL